MKYCLRADEVPVKGMKNVYSYAKLILMQKDSHIATAGDCSSTDSTLADEAFYFDATQSRVRGLTALTVWMLQLVLHKVRRLLSREVFPESTEHVRGFWIQWNSMLFVIKGNEYKFNPSTLWWIRGQPTFNSTVAYFWRKGSHENHNLSVTLPS